MALTLALFFFLLEGWVAVLENGGVFQETARKVQAFWVIRLTEKADEQVRLFGDGLVFRDSFYDGLALDNVYAILYSSLMAEGAGVFVFPATLAIPLGLVIGG